MSSIPKSLEVVELGIIPLQKCHTDKNWLDNAFVHLSYISGNCFYYISLFCMCFTTSGSSVLVCGLDVATLNLILLLLVCYDFCFENHNFSSKKYYRLKGMTFQISVHSSLVYFQKSINVVSVFIGMNILLTVIILLTLEL